MMIPQYWARAAIDEDGNEIPSATEATAGFIGVGWSDNSDDEAYRHALNRARSALDRYRHDIDGIEDLREQYYSDRPLREPVVDELYRNNRRIAAITRNVYGAYVLNAANAAFIDIDVPVRRRPRRPKTTTLKPGLFARLFGRSTPERPSTEPGQAQAKPEDRIRQRIEQMPGVGIMLYRTPNGYRGLVTHRPYDPADRASQRLLEAFDADRLYVKLCEAQRCFRARLTPKPWRIKMGLPPKIFPFSDPKKQAAFDRWSDTYESRCNGFAACEPVSEKPWGNPRVHPDIAPVMALHDELACSPDKPLA